MVLQNRSARHDYFIEEVYDAGMVLSGTEVKSIRAGKVNFKDSFCYFVQGELWVKNLHIAAYQFGTSQNHPEVQDRKLLLTKRELRKLESRMKENGYTLVPLKIYFSEKGFAKMQIGLAKGKKLHDKRESQKRKEAEREMKRYLK
jgi:SsrA-binding protein